MKNNEQLIVSAILSVALFLCILVIAHTVFTAENVIGNSIENLENLKRDFEKDLPRTEECVLVYEYVPVKKEKSE